MTKPVYPLHKESFNLLKKLVDNACVNYDTKESGNEIKSVRVLQEFFESHGFSDYEIFEPAPNRGNFLLRIKGSDPTAPSIMYQSHLDVVPATENWTVDPFNCHINDGWIFGRGTLDMLLYTATQACAIVDLINSGYEPKGDIVFLAVADEEGGSTYGAKWLVENVPDKIKTDYLIGEFGGAILTSLSGEKKITFVNAEKSPGWTKMTVRGTPGHASLPYDTTSAIKIASNILNNIRLHPPKPVITDAYKDFIKGLDLSWFQYFLFTQSWLVDLAIGQLNKEDKGAAATLHGLTRMTCEPTIVKGGKKTNIIPDKVEIEFDIRLLPGQDWSTITKYFKSVIPDEYSQYVEIEPNLVEASIADPIDTPLIDSIEEVTSELFPGYQLTPLLFPAVTDARIFRNLGIKCYGFTLLGDRLPSEDLAKYAHGDDERIPVESLKLSYEFFKKLPKNLWKKYG